MYRINHKPMIKRRPRIRPWLILWLLLPGLLPVQSPSALAQTSEPYAMPAPVRRLTFEGAEVTGNSRTSEKLVLQELALKPGQEISQGAILEAVDRLRLSGLFDQVDFFTRPGSQRGHLVLVVEVVEKAAAPSSAGFRFGTGNTDLDGWYIIPLEFSASNLLKHGEQIDVQFRLGYRLFGFLFRYQDNNLGAGRFFWGGSLSSFNTQPVFYLNGTEAVHRVDRGALDLHLGYRIGSRWAVDFGMKLENVDARFQAEYYQDDSVRGINKGDLIPWEDLPPQMVADSDERKRTVLRGDLVLDTKSPQLLAATPVSGFWGRLRLEGTLDSAGDFPGASLDVRHYQSLIGGVLSLRAHTAAVGNRAPFYDRLYLGGLYTVRGFPSQSLTRPEGDTWLWQGNLEFRAPLLGDPSLPRVAGSLFLDVGQSGSFDISPTASPAVGAGWGLRLRIFETIYLGLDAAVPLTESPAAEAFHVNASLGWNF